MAAIQLYSRLGRAAGLALLALAPAGCDTLSTGVEPLRSGVEFTLSDGYDLNGTGQGLPTPYLGIVTQKIYGCMNYGLRTSVRQSGNTTTVELQGVHRNDVCLTAAGPATFRTALPLPTGRSTLVFRGLGAEDSYTVMATDSVIEVSPAAGTISRTSVPRSWRVPANTLAATCNLATATVAGPAARCGAFHDSLAALGGLSPYVFGTVATPPSPPFGVYANETERVYRYASEATLASARALMQRLARNDSAFYLSLRTWRNESYLSWWP